MTRLSSPRTPARRRQSTNPNARSDVSLNPCFLPSGEPVPSADLPAIVRRLQEGDNRVILSLSGKDSLAAWLFLRENKFDVIPYFCYSVPGLSYDVEWINYLSKKLKTKIYRFLHPASASLFSNYCYQSPERVGTVARVGLQEYDFTYLESEIRDAESLSPLIYSAVGIRAKDNLMRHRLVHQMGPLGMKKRRYWWAVWDFSHDDTMAIIRRHGIKLSRAYEIWGATGDVLTYNFLKLLSQKSPQDFEKVRQMYPLIDAEIFRYEQVK
jgi:hypothetical protein